MGVLENEWEWWRLSGSGGERVGLVENEWEWWRMSGTGGERVGLVENEWEWWREIERVLRMLCELNEIWEIKM